MSELTTFRDHCRTMADPNAWAGAHPWPKTISTMCGSAHPGGHERCAWGWQACRCSCHDADRPKPPTAAERDLWTRLADEIDAYLTSDTPAPTDDHTEPLWETS